MCDELYKCEVEDAFVIDSYSNEAYNHTCSGSQEVERSPV